ncbi:MAG: GNAT family N-acetyltransferase [Verrucomicrobiales bacterium]|nr:GNAT family N-acetyltransferase [Verrucomicrobiales bacterium]
MTGKRKTLLLDGTPCIIRPISPADRNAFVDGFEELSEESRFRRFFFNKKTLTESELVKLANPDGYEHIAYGVAALEDGETETPIAVGHCFRQKDEPDLAEVALVTSDLWQGFGAGSELVKSLAAASLEKGIRRWFAVMLPDNDAMLRLLQKYGTNLRENLTGGVVEVFCDIDEKAVYK